MRKQPGCASCSGGNGVRAKGKSQRTCLSAGLPCVHWRILKSKHLIVKGLIQRAWQKSNLWPTD